MSSDREKLLVEFVSASFEDQEIVFGSIANAEGEAMGYYFPSSGSGFLSVTWKPMARYIETPVALWSDGNCEHIEFRKIEFDKNQLWSNDRRVPLCEAATWLGWSLRGGDRFFLAHLHDVVVGTWAGREFADGLGGFWDQSSDDTVTTAFEWSLDNGGDMPEKLSDRRKNVVSRYNDTRERLRAVDKSFDGAHPLVPE